MASTIITDVFNPDILAEAVQGVFAQKMAFMGSPLVRSGAVVIEGTMPESGRDAIGKTITVPYFGTLGEFVSNSDGNAVTPSKVQQTSEQASVTRDSMAFSVSQWAIGNAAVNPNVGDPYEESARQILAAAERAIDKRIIDASAASGVYVKDVYSSTVPVFINWDLVVDARIEGWGDENEEVVGMLVHSHVQKDLMKLKDNAGRPLWMPSAEAGQMNGGPVQLFNGLPVVVSDRVPLTGSTMGAVTSSGTSPPAATLAGTPLGPWKLVIDAITGDATTITFRFSVDGGNIWSASTLTALDDSVPVALIDPNIDSRVGVNGKTGLTVAFAAGTFNADNLYTSTASMKVMTLLLKRRALTFWYNRAALGMKTDQNIFDDSKQGAMHLYGVAHRYRRVAGGTKPGVVQLVHNVSGF